MGQVNLLFMRIEFTYQSESAADALNVKEQIQSLEYKVKLDNALNEENTFDGVSLLETSDPQATVQTPADPSVPGSEPSQCS